MNSKVFEVCDMNSDERLEIDNIDSDIVRLTTLTLIRLTTKSKLIATTTIYAIAHATSNFLNQSFLWRNLDFLTVKCFTLSTFSMLIWKTLRKFNFVIRFSRKLREIWIIWFRSFRIKIVEVKAFIRLTYKVRLISSTDSNRKSLLAEREAWWIEIITSDCDEITIVLRIWTHRWIDVLNERIFTVEVLRQYVI